MQFGLKEKDFLEKLSFCRRWLASAGESCAIMACDGVLSSLNNTAEDNKLDNAIVI